MLTCKLSLAGNPATTPQTGTDVQSLTQQLYSRVRVTQSTERPPLTAESATIVMCSTELLKCKLNYIQRIYDSVRLFFTTRVILVGGAAAALPIGDDVCH